MSYGQSPETSPQAKETRSTGLSKKTIGAIILGIVAVIFIAQNSEKGTVQFLFFDWTVGIWFGLLVAFLLGVLTGWFLPKLRNKSKAKSST